MRDTSEQDRRYLGAAAAYGGAIERLARGYEADAELRRDLVQDVHVALWRSFAGYDGRCSERTWVFRVAHNAAADHVRARRRTPQPLDLADTPEVAAAGDPESETDAHRTADRLAALIQRLRPADRQVMLLYLEDLGAAGIGEVTGLSAGAVAARIHRIKALLARQFAHEEEP
jgi:RNA polymerase sigma-70 factor, ECF subfamily